MVTRRRPSTVASPALVRPSAPSLLTVPEDGGSVHKPEDPMRLQSLFLLSLLPSSFCAELGLNPGPCSREANTVTELHPQPVPSVLTAEQEATEGGQGKELTPRNSGLQASRLGPGPLLQR